MKPGLYITATPIGNLGDITLRALEVLKASDIVICEDTRQTAKLLQHYGLNKKLGVYNDHSDESVRDEILGQVAAGKIVALVSDAGTPLISDPGFKLVRDARSRNLYVTTLPGASSVISALTIAGLPTDSFLFLGFVQPKVEARKKQFEKIKEIDTTIVLFERGSRIADVLASAREVFGDIECAIVREISKLYEEVMSDSLSNLLGDENKLNVKGEVVILLSNKVSEKIALTDEELNVKLTNLLYNNSVKDASQLAHELYGIKKKAAYERLLELKETDGKKR